MNNSKIRGLASVILSALILTLIAYKLGYSGGTIAFTLGVSLLLGITMGAFIKFYSSRNHQENASEE